MYKFNKKKLFYQLGKVSLIGPKSGRLTVL